MEKELKKLEDAVLAKRMVKYIEKTDSLLIRAEYYLGKDCPEQELCSIRRDYKALREAIKEDARQAVYSADGSLGSPVYENRFAPSIINAAAWGYYVPEDCVADKALLKALSDGRERLTESFSYDYWRILAEG